MPHCSRHGYDYWHQNDEGRLIVGGFRDADMDSEFTAEEATTERIQKRSAASRRRCPAGCRR